MADESGSKRPAKPSFANADDDAVIAEVIAPRPLDEVQSSLDFWRQRRRGLPLYRRGARREAQARIMDAEQELRAARRAQYGPTLVEQLSEAVGITISPARIRRLVVSAALTLIVLALAVVMAAVAFWPELEPIIRFFIGGGGGEGDG